MSRRVSPHRKKGISLLEVIAALTLTAIIAAVGIRHLSTPGTTAHQRTCDMTRQTLQGYAERYRDDTGQFPRRNLAEIESTNYAGAVLPTCPVTGQAYQIRRGVVGCPTHEATR